MLRFKRIAESEIDCTPHLMVVNADKGRLYPCKLQHSVCYDTDNEVTYWEWQDVELVGIDEDDYETEPR